MKPVRCPVVPRVDVNVRAAHPRFLDAHHHVMLTAAGPRPLLEDQTASRLTLDKGLHCAGHALKDRPDSPRHELLVPKPFSARLFAGRDAQIKSKISSPTCCTVASPSAIRPAFTSMLSRI